MAVMEETLSNVLVILVKRMENQILEVVSRLEVDVRRILIKAIYNVIIVQNGDIIQLIALVPRKKVKRGCKVCTRRCG